jgi:hypothetical protein
MDAGGRATHGAVAENTKEKAKVKLRVLVPKCVGCAESS